MVSHVYFAFHSRLPAFKPGKGNVIEPRLRQIGLSFFDVERSFALEVADESTAHNLERIFHKIFKGHRWKDPADLPRDGISEWFSVDCLTSFDALLESLGFYYEFKKIPIVINEKAPPLKRPQSLPKALPIEEGVHPSELDGLIYGAERLSELLDKVRHQYPDVLITYVENGDIQFRNYPECLIPFIDTWRSETTFEWREKRGEETWSAMDSAVRVIGGSYRTKVGDSSAASLPMEKMWLKLFWDSFPSENLPDSLTNFIGRWPSLPLPITSPTRYA